MRFQFKKNQNGNQGQCRQKNSIDGILDFVLPLIQRISGSQNNGKLRHFGRLQRHATREIYPTVTTVAVTGHKQCHNQKDQGNEIECLVQIPQCAVVDAGHKQHGGKSHNRYDCLRFDKMVNVAVFGITTGITGRKQHNQAVSQRYRQRTYKSP